MNYVQFHWGDWVRSTQDLTALEKGVYIDLLQRYYQKERPLTDEECKRIARAYANAEQEAMQYVLQTFFTKDAEGYRNSRCDEEIAKANGVSRKRADAARKSWAKRNGVNPQGSKQEQSKCTANAEQEQSKCKATPILHNSNTPISNNPLTPLQGENAAAVVEPSSEEKKKAPARDKGTRLGIDALPDEWRDYCLKVEPELDPQRVFEDFRDYWRSLSGAKAIKTDWRAVWQTHVRSFRNAPEWKRNPVLKKAVESKDDYLPNSRFKTQEARLKNDDYGLSEIFGEGWK